MDVTGTASARPFQWPDGATWLAYARFLAIFLVVFLPVYMGSGYLAARMPHRAIVLSLAWEQSIPLVPWMVWWYLSLYTIYGLPLLHLDAGELRRLTWQAVVIVLCAGAVFLVLPTTSAFAKVPVDSIHAPLLSLIAQVDTSYNLLPSLHVSCAALLLLTCAQRASTTVGVLYRGWLAMLCASTVLVHQHHLLDVAAGLLLTDVVRRLMPLGVAPGRTS